MKTIFLSLISLISFLFAFTAHALDTAQGIVVDILAQDETVVQEVRSKGDNIFIKLAPAYLADSITVRTSDKNQDAYRIWFNNEQNLVSNRVRGKNAWSDRVQTQAKYIEYWHNNVLVLHLQKQ